MASAMMGRSFQQAVTRIHSSHTHNSIFPTVCSINWSGNHNRTQQNRTFRSYHNRTQQNRTFRSSAAICKKKSFYDVLGLTQSATKEEIKSKYRDMAKKCHPDLNRDDKNAEKKFREITEAYEVLESDSKRQQYDAYGGEGMEDVDYGRGGGSQSHGGFDGFGGFEGHDIFDMFHEMERKQRGRVGKDVELKLKLTFMEAINGCTKEVRYNATSTVNQATRRGKNKPENKIKTVDVKIPAGVDTGMTIQMEGHGCNASQGNHIGDLVIEITVEKDSYFRREKSDVHSELHISIDQAILGSSADVRTLDGQVSMKINPGTQPGATFSITGKGVKKVNSTASKRGNHYVKIFVTIPSDISVRQKELLEMFAAEGSIEKDRKQGKTTSTTSNTFNKGEKEEEKMNRGKKMVIDEDDY